MPHTEPGVDQWIVAKELFRRGVSPLLDILLDNV